MTLVINIVITIVSNAFDAHATLHAAVAHGAHIDSHDAADVFIGCNGGVSEDDILHDAVRVDIAKEALVVARLEVDVDVDAADSMATTIEVALKRT